MNGFETVNDFWRKRYLKEFIYCGGSKIKFITGTDVTEKTQMTVDFADIATEEGFVSVLIDAKKTRLDDIKEIYIGIIKHCDIMQCFNLIAKSIVLEMGFNPDEIQSGISFCDHLSNIGQMDAITKRELRFVLNKMFLQNPLMDNNFALACAYIVGGILGHPILEENSRTLLLDYLYASSELGAVSIRKLGLSPTKITKYNARHMIRSLSELVRLSGRFGIVVCVDNVDILVNKNSLEEIRYTRQKREDSYESMRELIDEIDTLNNIMFVFAFHRKLLDDDVMGIKSYQALWMRIQNEVYSERFNYFSDIIDLDLLHSNIPALGLQL